MTKRTQKLFTLSLIFLTISIGVFGVALYVIQTRGHALIAKYDLVREQNAIEQRMSTVINIAEMSVAERTSLEEYFLSERGIIEFIANLEELARAERIEFDTTQLAVDPAKDAKPAILKIGFSFTGTQTQVVQFMKTIELLPYHKTIISSVIQESTTTQVGGNWEGNIIIHLTLKP